MIQSIEILIDKGYKVVIATNPLFPMKANLHRIRWAGLDPKKFSYISSFESNNHCKPHIEYYHEVLEAIEKKPESCFMVGNDVSDDLSVRTLGVETFLVTDCKLNHKAESYETDYEGNYQSFLEFVKGLPLITT